MNAPLTRTFTVLRQASNDDAWAVLVAALDTRFTDIRRAALQTLLDRGRLSELMEVVRRLSVYDDADRQLLAEHADRLQRALEYSLLHGDERAQQDVLELVQRFELLGTLPALVVYLRNTSGDRFDHAADVFRGLVDRLYEQTSSDDVQDGTTDVSKLKDDRRRVLENLRELCDESDASPRAILLLDAFLVLVRPHEPVHRDVLLNGPEWCRNLARERLQSSHHPGVMDLVAEATRQRFPLPSALEAISNREDVEFAAHLLRSLPESLPRRMRENLSQVTTIRWLDPAHATFQSLPPSLHTALVGFVDAVRVDPRTKQAVWNWLLHNGSPAARTAVLDGEFLDRNDRQQAVLEAAVDDDPRVQAWGTTQLRPQGVPQAFEMLLQRVQSDMPEVREAARQELSSFDLQALRQLYPFLKPDVARGAAQLVRELHPDCLDELSRELTSPIRDHRIDALRLTTLMDVLPHLLPVVLAVLEDEDSVVRREAAEVLASADGPQVEAALEAALQDESPRVRAEAARSCAAIRERSAALAAVSTSES